MKKDINIIGISCYYHDSAAALIQNGAVLSAIQEERLSRIEVKREKIERNERE